MRSLFKKFKVAFILNDQIINNNIRSSSYLNIWRILWEDFCQMYIIVIGDIKIEPAQIEFLLHREILIIIKLSYDNEIRLRV